MTNPYARPYERPEDADLTIPLVPDSGYSQPSQPPFTEETLVDPLPQAPRDPWGVASALVPARNAATSRSRSSGVAMGASASRLRSAS